MPAARVLLHPVRLAVRGGCRQLAGHGEERFRFLVVAEPQQEQPGGDQFGERPLPDGVRVGPGQPAGVPAARLIGLLTSDKLPLLQTPINRLCRNCGTEKNGE
jgi:hypothetical protein